MSEKYSFIQAEKANHPVSLLCKVLQVSTCGYYAHWSRPVAPRTVENQVLLEQIEAVHRESRGTYGSPRVHATLAQNGVSVGVNRVARLMRDNCIQGVSPRNWRTRTTISDPEVVAYPENLAARDFTPTGPNLLWVTDTTYIPTKEGWVYLAAILDCWSRKVVGYATGPRNDVDLCLRALNRAVKDRQPVPGLIHHSDRGATYTARAYQAALHEAGIVPSMSRRGDCYDNAVAESFFGTIKSELQTRVWNTRMQAGLEVFSYVEGWYNTRRLHSTLGYRSPNVYERVNWPILA